MHTKTQKNTSENTEKQYQLEHYTYTLPEKNIAQKPSIPHHNAKLLICKKNITDTDDHTYTLTDDIFLNITKYLDEKSILFFNNTKVFKARIPLNENLVIRHSGYKTTIKDGEILVYKIIDDKHIEALVSDDKNFKPWSSITLDPKKNITLTVLSLTSNGVILQSTSRTIFKILETYWQLPLPPYITYKKEKEQRYQTHFAKHEGSAAAPTASLHFTQELFKKLEQQKIQKQFLTLHVGLGTFKPIFDEDIRQYHIHDETAIIPIWIFKEIASYHKQKRKMIPVGTTMTRTLESLPYLYQYLKNISTKNIQEQSLQAILQLTTEEQQFRENIIMTLPTWKNFIKSCTIQHQDKTIHFNTQLYIYPWFHFNLINWIITNFHLPKTSLMIMISARMGKQNLEHAYQHAITNNYKFYSFWDGMLIY